MNEEKKDENAIETVSTQKTKTKRRFNWTPAKRAAFEKCIAARKQKLANKETKPTPQAQPQEQVENISSHTNTKKKHHKKRKYDSSSDSDSNSTSSSSSISIPPIRKSKLKRTIQRQIQKALPSSNTVVYQQPMAQPQPQSQSQARPTLPRYLYL
jgi:hypothetical protein